MIHADMSSIQVDQLRIEKGKRVIIDDLNFRVQSGSLTGLIGPSGSGKTTLMRAIVGVQRLSGGSLSVMDQPAGSHKLRGRIGYMTQDAAVYGDLTVVQNLNYFAAILSADAAQVDAVIDHVRLSALRDQQVVYLSGGERARVSLAIALLGNPDILVLDEPTVGLDPLLREELWQLFAELVKQGKTLLVSSHVMDEADKCDTLLLLRDGKLLWQDSRVGLLRHTNTNSVQDAFLQIIKTEAGK